MNWNEQFEDKLSNENKIHTVNALKSTVDFRERSSKYAYAKVQDTKSKKNAKI